MYNYFYYFIEKNLLLWLIITEFTVTIDLAQFKTHGWLKMHSLFHYYLVKLARKLCISYSSDCKLLLNLLIMSWSLIQNIYIFEQSLQNYLPCYIFLPNDTNYYLMLILFIMFLSVHHFQRLFFMTIFCSCYFIRFPLYMTKSKKMCIIG